MIYREFAPSPALAGIVDRLYFIEGRADEIGAEPIPPDGHTEIIVHAGDPFVEIGEDGSAARQERVLLAGQVTRAVRVAPRGVARMIGARLRPDAARRLTGVPQHEIVDTIVPLAQIDRRFSERLEDDVASRETAEDMAAALDRALVRSAEGAPPRTPAGAAVDFAAARGGLVRVTGLAGHAGVSARQLERLFHEHVGVGPKLFLRVLRFQHVLSSLRDGQGDTAWAAIAARHGFYDQSHFIRDFKAFVGAAPGAFRPDDRSLASLFSAITRR